MIKSGDYIVCVDDTGTANLVAGKSYEVEVYRKGSKYVTVYSGSGSPETYYLSRFDTVSADNEQTSVISTEPSCTCTGLEMLSGIWSPNCGYHKNR